LKADQLTTILTVMQLVPPAVDERAYQVRFGLTRQDLVLLPFMLVAAAVGLFAMVEGRPWLGSVATAFGGGYVGLRLMQLVSRRAALRVDANGLTLGMTPPWPATKTALIPWSDLTRIMLWRQQAGPNSIHYIGVQRPEGTPPLPGSVRNPTLRALIPVFVPAHVPVQVACDSRQINGWRLDQKRLAAAVAHFAPQVEIVDLE
jgi:hypothetical protein